MSRFPNWVDEHASRTADRDRDFPEVRGFSGPKRRGNPLGL